MRWPRQLALPRASLLGLLAAVLWVAGGAPPACAQSPSNSEPVQGPVHRLHLTLNLLPLSGSVQPGGTTEVGLHFLLDKGWHVYWVNAGDSGEPPRIQWTPIRGITVDPMQFPAPQRLPLGPLMDFGYEDEVLFPMVLHAAPGLKAPSTKQLSAHVDWLVCREVCIPGKADLTLPLQVTRQPEIPNRDAQAIFERFRAKLPKALPPQAKAKFAPTSSGFALAVLDLPAGKDFSTAEFFPLDQNQIDNPAPQLVRSLKNGLEIRLKKDENLQAVPARLNGVLRFADGIAYEVHAAPGAVPSTGTSAAGGSGGLGNVLRIVLLAFLGGVILNLMPCVFPVLFIKGLSLVGSSHEARGRLRAHGAAYALGILVAFWAVAALLIGLRAGGDHLGWGFQFQSASFLAVIALLLFFLGLSLAGMFEIGLTVTGAGSGLASRGGLGGSFFTGVLAMVVATPCTAPFMGAALGFALVQPAAVAFVIFTALGLGLAAPYVLLTLQPAWTKLLPRPGAWMEILKQLTSVPVFATVIWLVLLFAESAGTNSLAGLLAGFLLLAIAAWILGHWPARRLASLCALLVVAFAVGLPLYALRAFAVPQSNAASTSPGPAADRALWQPFSEAAVDKYRAEGRPVFVDFTAGWCLSCQVNERLVLDRADVRKGLRDSGVVLVRADWTHHDDDIARALNRLGRSGVPTYVLYAPGAPPRILPEVLTPGIVFDALHQLEARLGTVERP